MKNNKRGTKKANADALMEIATQVETEVTKVLTKKKNAHHRYHLKIQMRHKEAEQEDQPSRSQFSTGLSKRPYRIKAFLIKVLNVFVKVSHSVFNPCTESELL